MSGGGWEQAESKIDGTNTPVELICNQNGTQAMTPWALRNIFPSIVEIKLPS